MKQKVYQTTSEKTTRRVARDFDPVLADFVSDYHIFASKWPTQKIAEALKVDRQLAYYHAKKKLAKRGKREK